MLVKKCKEDINGSIQMSKKATSNHTESQSTKKAEEICPDSLPSQTVVTSCHMTQYLLPSRIQEIIKCCNRSHWIVKLFPYTID